MPYTHSLLDRFCALISLSFEVCSSGKHVVAVLETLESLEASCKAFTCLFELKGHSTNFPHELQFLTQPVETVV